MLSNDSFQEFHGEHPWLFDSGRLIGATPVPGVGWIFVARTPVRGPRSRTRCRRDERAKKQVERAIASRDQGGRRAGDSAEDRRTHQADRARATRPTRPAPQAVNDPTTFIAFVAEHPLGAEIEAEVESFTSHGAVVRAGELARLRAALRARRPRAEERP